MARIHKLKRCQRLPGPGTNSNTCNYHCTLPLTYSNATDNYTTLSTPFYLAKPSPYGDTTNPKLCPEY